ncbi:MAG: LLM class flavin-dependent oxidoreductase [bacterium]|nr:LLM class flavin-dependent oxidoreductase [bacterium]
MNIRADIKNILLESDVTITKLAKLMSEKTGKFYSQSNISQKLMRGTLKFEEAKIIGEILGYELKFVKIKL